MYAPSKKSTGGELFFTDDWETVRWLSTSVPPGPFGPYRAAAFYRCWPR